MAKFNSRARCWEKKLDNNTTMRAKAAQQRKTSFFSCFLFLFSLHTNVLCVRESTLRESKRNTTANQLEWVNNQWNGIVGKHHSISSYCKNEWTGMSASFSRPLRDVNSITAKQPSTIPPDIRTSSEAAFNDPPVAIKSSMIRILWSFLMTPHCISNTSNPYSRAYSTLIVSPGNFPFFLTGTQPIESSEAIRKLKRNPLASSPTTASICGWCFLT